MSVGKHVVFVSFYSELIPRQRLMANVLLLSGWKVSVILWDRGNSTVKNVENSDLYSESTITLKARTRSAMLILIMPILYFKIVKELKMLDEYDALVLTHYFLLPVMYLINSPSHKKFYDAAEYYCEDILEYVGRLGSLFRPLIRIVEKLLLRSVDAVFTIDSNQGWLADYYKKMGKPVQVIWNLPDKEDDATQLKIQEVGQEFSNKDIVIYVGVNKICKRY